MKAWPTWLRNSSTLLRIQIASAMSPKTAITSRICETCGWSRNQAKSKLGSDGSASKLGNTPCVTAQAKRAIAQAESTIASTRLELTSVVYVAPLTARCAIVSRTTSPARAGKIALTPTPAMYAA